MFHNSEFQSWRKVKQSAFDSYINMHYHKVSDECYFVVRDLLQSLLRARVELGGTFVVSMTDEGCRSVLDFLNQMQLAYIHPRSTSAKFLFSLEKRAQRTNPHA